MPDKVIIIFFPLSLIFLAYDEGGKATAKLDMKKLPKNIQKEEKLLESLLNPHKN